ncbi:rhodanese-like domain-containing protein [Formosa sp. S-31]|uniref:rhodanese-like domain-containing protein n=1 Tax=Formosa sp. S-31 TaxID=2790949 RepID=UPI003EBA0748
MADLTQEEWADQLANDDNAVILDVRTDDEVDQGYIPNAKHIDIYLGEEFVKQVDALDKSKTYYVYCRSGMRSAKACAIMNQLGFENTYNLLGGFMDWAGDIVEP